MKLDKHPEAEAIIFDLDGTLSNSLPVHIESWHKTCKHFNCEYDEEITYQLTGAPTIRFAERLISDHSLDGVDPVEMAKMKQQHFWSNINLLEANDAVADLVYRYHGKIPMAIGTGASRKSALLQLEKLGLTEYFDVIVTADDVTKHKPEPHTFLKCAELMNVEPTKCHVLEDGQLGMQAAVAAGMHLTDVRPFVKN